MAEKKNKPEKKSTGKKSGDAKSAENKSAKTKETPPEFEYRRLLRSRSDKKIAGICGGLAEYFSIDPTLVRIIAVFSCFAGGAGFIGYLIGWIIIPENLSDTPISSKPIGPYLGVIFGISLVLVGLGMVIDQLRGSFWVPWWVLEMFSWESVFALALIVCGILVIVHLMRKENGSGGIFAKPEGAKASASQGESRNSQLFRSTVNRKISGVCGGIAEYFTIDPTIVRIIWVVGTIVTKLFPGIIIYIAMAYIVPDRPSAHEKTL